MTKPKIFTPRSDADWRDLVACDLFLQNWGDYVVISTDNDYTASTNQALIRNYDVRNYLILREQFSFSPNNMPLAEQAMPLWRFAEREVSARPDICLYLPFITVALEDRPDLSSRPYAIAAQFTIENKKRNDQLIVWYLQHEQMKGRSLMGSYWTFPNDPLLYVDRRSSNLTPSVIERRIVSYLKGERKSAHGIVPNLSDPYFCAPY